MYTPHKLLCYDDNTKEKAKKICQHGVSMFIELNIIIHNEQYEQWSNEIQLIWCSWKKINWNESRQRGFHSSFSSVFILANFCMKLIRDMRNWKKKTTNFI